MMTIHLVWLTLSLTLAVGGLAWLAPPADAVESCCGITTIDAKTQTVTAKETKTGRTFQFQVADAKTLGSLKVGQAVHADFKTMKVSVRPNAAEPCCNIVNVRPAATPVR